MSSLSIARLQRNVVSVSITHLAKRLENLERNQIEANLHHARDIEQQLNSLDSEYWKRHFAVIDLIDDEALLSREQELLDNHDDRVSSLSVRISLLQSSMSTEKQRRKCLSELCSLQKKILSIHDNVTSSTPESHLHQYAKTIRSYKAELRKICLESYNLDVSDSDEIYSLESQLDEDVFNCCLKIRRLLPSANTSLAPSSLLEYNKSITPQVEKELQAVPDMSLVVATSSTLVNTNSHSNETQTLTSDSLDSIDTCEIPLLMVVTDEPSTHPSCETTYSIDRCPEVINSRTSLAISSSGHSTHKLCIPIITCCAADFSHINGVDSLLDCSPHSLLDCSPHSLLACSPHSLLDRLIRTSMVVAILIKSYLILFLHVCHGRRHSTQNTFAHSRLCIEIIRSLTPSHVT